MSHNMQDIEYLMAVLNGEEPTEQPQVTTTSSMAVLHREEPMEESPYDSEVATTSSRVRNNSRTYTSEDFSDSEDFSAFDDSEASDSDSHGSNCSSTTVSVESDADIGNSTEECSEDTRRPSLKMPPPEEKLYIENAANLTPFDYFKVFFNNNFLNVMANWINWHASIVIARPHKPQSRVTKWKDTNGTEVLTFLGILFLMGTVKLNRLNNYWKKHHLVQFSLEDYMSRNRFLLILRMLYFTRQDVSDNIYLAVEPLIDHFHQIMKETVYPGKDLVIDELMVLFRGRLGIRHKNGVKIYVLADPQGLVHRIHMYKGSADSEVSGQGHVDKVVLKLFNDYLHAGHSLYLNKQRSQRRRSNNAATVVTSKPFKVVKNNQFMKGVDSHDQMLSYYPSARKSTRWFKKIGIYILETMVDNAFFLHRKGTGKIISLETFREMILSEILPPAPSSSQSTRKQYHLPRPVNRNNNGCLKRRMCFRCKSVHKRRKTSGMYCPDCDVGLCLDCYKPHHDFL